MDPDPTAPGKSDRALEGSAEPQVARTAITEQVATFGTSTRVSGGSACGLQCPSPEVEAVLPSVDPRCRAARRQCDARRPSLEAQTGLAPHPPLQACGSPAQASQ